MNDMRRAAVYNASQPWDVNDLPRLFLARIGDKPDKASPVFAIAVRKAQLNLGLKPDGKLGPKTLNMFQETYVGPVPTFAPNDIPPGESNFVVNGRSMPTPFDVYHGAPFRERPRGDGSVTQIDIHESVTNDPKILKEDDTTERILRRKKCGVQIMLGPDKTTIQHNDLETAMVAHAGKKNRHSIGIEVVGPYYETRAPYWTKLIKARWAHKGKYAVPPIGQMIRLVEILEWLCACEDLDIPRRFIGDMGSPSGRRLFLMGRHPERKSIIRTGPGIWAHGYTAHADGFFPALYAFLVMEIGMDYEPAYTKAIMVAELAGQRAKI